MPDRDLVEAAVCLANTDGGDRQAGFDSIQQKQMVLQFVKKNGRIIRQIEADRKRTGSLLSKFINAHKRACDF